MRKVRFRKGSWIIIPLILVSLFSSPVQAENFIITEPTDVWFEYSEPTLFVAQTYMVDGYNSDPMIWLYNEAGDVLAANDDSYGLQSYISLEVPAGRYRLRAGICCGDPDAWHTNSDWNLQYELGFDGFGSMQTTTTIPATTTTEETTTTTTSTTTTSTTTTSTTTTTTSTTTSTTSTTSTTTSTTVPTTSTTTSTTSTTIPDVTTTVQQTTTTEPVAPSSTTTTSTSTTVFVFPTLASVPETTTTSLVAPTTTSTTTTTTIPREEPAGVDEAVSTLLEDTEVLTKEEIIDAVKDIISNGVSKEEAVALAINPKILESVSADEAKEIFQEIQVNELSLAQEAKLVETLNNAPDDIKETFENTIDIFGEGLDEYTPTGSSVDVKTRRAVIAVTAVATTLTTAPVSSGGGSAPSNGGPSGGGEPSGDGGSSEDRKTRRSRRK